MPINKNITYQKIGDMQNSQTIDQSLYFGAMII